MTDQDNQEKQDRLRERIVRLMRANEQAQPAPVNQEDIQKLKSAASRLDQMLKDAEDAGREDLKNAAARLDQMLTDIGKGKDITERIKRRERKGTR